MPKIGSQKGGRPARAPATRRRLVLGGTGLLLALLVAAIWIGPGLLDWNRYRDGIAAFAAQRLGRPVRIGGAVTLQLLPQPILTAADVTVEDAGDGLGLRARALRLRVGLAALLAGGIDARELTLQGAELRLPWPPPAGALVQFAPSWAAGLQARLEDSRLQVGDLALTKVDATLATDPDTGTLSVAGVGESGPRRWQFTARLAKPGRDGAAGLDISLDGQGKLRDTGGTFSGQIGADGALAGRVAGRGPDLSLLMPAPALPWRGDGRLSAAAGLAVADELALEIGGAPARGAVALRVTPQARLDLAIAAGRLDLDAWLPALLGRNPALAREGLRDGLPTGIDISAEAATLAGGTLRRLRGAVDLGWTPAGMGTIQLRDVAAILPGEAELSLAGQVAAGADPSFDGTVKLAAPDLRATLRWLQRVLPAAAALPPGVLRTAALSGHLVADAAQARVTDLQGTLDGAAVKGSASVRTGARLGVTAALSIERLALDAWFPDPAGLAAAAPAAMPGLRGIDADIRLDAARADWGPVPLGAIAIELQTEAARMLLRRLEARPLGMRLAMSGQVLETGRLADGKLDLSGTDLGVLRPALAALSSARPLLARELQALLRGAGSLVVSAAGTPDALAGRVTLELGDLRIEAQPVVNLAIPRWSGPLTLHHPGAARLLEVLGLGATVAWLGDGSFSLVGQLTAAPGRIEMQGATLGAGSLRATGRLLLDGTRLTGELAAETLPLPLIYPRSPDPLPLAWLRGWQAAVRIEAAEVLVGLTPVLRRASADLVLENGVLNATRGTARLPSGTLAGSGTIDAAADPPRVAAQLQGTGIGIAGGVFETPLDLIAGEANATLDLSAAGHSPAALLATLGGSGTVRLRDGVLSGFDLPASAAALAQPTAREVTEGVRAAIRAGTTPFTAIDAPLDITRGVVTTRTTLASPAGTGLLTGSFDLLGSTLDARLTLTPAGEGNPPLVLRLTGTPGAPLRTPELAGLARWLAERPTAPQ